MVETGGPKEYKAAPESQKDEIDFVKNSITAILEYWRKKNVKPMCNHIAYFNEVAKKYEGVKESASIEELHQLLQKMLDHPPPIKTDARASDVEILDRAFFMWNKKRKRREMEKRKEEEAKRAQDNNKSSSDVIKCKKSKKSKGGKAKKKHKYQGAGIESQAQDKHNNESSGDDNEWDEEDLNFHADQTNPEETVFCGSIAAWEFGEADESIPIKPDNVLYIKFNEGTYEIQDKLKKIWCIRLHPFTYLKALDLRDLFFDNEQIDGPIMKAILKRFEDYYLFARGSCEQECSVDEYFTPMVQGVNRRRYLAEAAMMSALAKEKVLKFKELTEVLYYISIVYYIIS
jgi:hypothetical protein